MKLLLTGVTHDLGEPITRLFPVSAPPLGDVEEAAKRQSPDAFGMSGFHDHLVDLLDNPDRPRQSVYMHACQVYEHHRRCRYI